MTSTLDDDVSSVYNDLVKHIEVASAVAGVLSSSHLIGEIR